ncbi:MAG: helix-turn-helix domain-containing protein [Planktothrix sp.]
MSHKPITWDSIRDRVLANPEVKAEYDALEAEFELASRAIAIRASTGLTQREFAERVGMKQSQIARIESGTQIPKLETLAKLAAAAGYAVEVNFIPIQDNSRPELKPIRFNQSNMTYSAPLVANQTRRETLLALLESQDEVMKTVREKLGEKSKEEIATELENCWNISDEEDRRFAVKNIFTPRMSVIESTRSTVGNGNNDTEIDELTDDLLDRLGEVLGENEL